MEGFRHEHQWKQEPETRNYRESLRRSIIAAKEFDGTEAKYVELMAELVKFEEVIKASPSLQKEPAPARETAAALTFHPQRPRDIQNLLDLAIKSRDRVLHHAFSQIEKKDEIKREKSKNTPLYTVRVPGVFLPTNGRKNPETGKGETFEPIRFEERTREVLDVLQSIGVFSDDLIIMMGNVSPNMIRKEAYSAIRIPRLERSVLVCDQAREAIFAIRGDVSADELLNSTKDELLEKLGGNIKRIVKTETETWKPRLASLLTTEEAWVDKVSGKSTIQKNYRKKVDVREFRHDQIRKRVSEVIGSAEAWVKISGPERRKVFVEGMGISALASFFGVGGYALGKNEDFYRLGIAIYGEQKVLKDLLEIEARSVDDWRRRIQSVTSPETWIKESKYGRASFQIDGRGMSSLGNLFEIEGSPVSQKIAYYKLGLKIWPNDKELEHELEIEQRTPDQWREVIRAKTSPEEFASMRSPEIRDYKIDGRSVDALGTCLGIKVDRNSMASFYNLALRIYPNHPLILSVLNRVSQKREVVKKAEKKTAEEWKKLLRDQFTPETWLQINRRQFKPDGVSIIVLARILGVPGDVLMNVPFLEMSQAIFPESELIKNKLNFEKEHQRKKEARTLEDWRQEVSSKIDPESWLNLGVLGRRAFEIDGVKINALATIFGVEGSPIQSGEVFLRLGLAIWPENQHIKGVLNKLTSGEIKKGVKKPFSTF